MNWARDILKDLPRPEGIIIARSQNPRFVPVEHVDELQCSTLEMLNKIYSGQTPQ
ncbi:MAG: hypothetical protein JW727_03360 [Candidatus Aenigmarchaeota archaeon]|nr:hypothetical protein [Candidatus Aenigmarchaeota archaeon]